MKIKLSFFVMVVIMLTSVFSFAACNNTDEPQPPNSTLNFEQVYARAQETGYTGSLEELITAFKGDSAYKIAVSKGYKGSEADWLASLVGASGKDGADGQDGENGTNGITPHIGANGNWYIGTTDTGVKAKGQDGSSGTNGTDGKSAYQIWLNNGHTGTENDFLEWIKGQDGADGTNGANGNDGTDGLSTYQIFKKYNQDYSGTEQEWINALINGHLLRFTITFKAAGSPDIVRSIFYGYDLIDIPPSTRNGRQYW